MNIRQIQEARELHGIDGWGASYFSINDLGHVVCHPTAEEHLGIDLPEVIEKVKEQGSKPPMILRFPQIIDNQIQKLHQAFKEAVWEYSYPGKHQAVFPYKVNQRREFIDNIVEWGRKYNYGLEVGSKTEFIAALNYELSENASLICNGFKDKEFIELGFIAAAMKKNVILVVEGPDELQQIIDMAKVHKHVPQIGMRVKLYSRGSGKWTKSSGESSKFGLTTLEVLEALKMISDADLKDKFTMLHFHIGSQITEIKRVKNAIKEAARVYAKICKMSYTPKFLDIGGGIGVDYDGSKTSFHSSANYSLKEFASDCIYQIGEVCKNEKVPCPDIITESGRIIAAHHSVVITDIREIQGATGIIQNEELNYDLISKAEEGDEVTPCHKDLTELRYILENINHKNFVEYYHDAIEYYDEMFTLFNLGYVNLEERGIAEQLFNRICQRSLYFSYFDRHQLEEFQELQQRMVSKFLANFSIFQSMPDAWAIDQLFPVMPLSHHELKPSLKSTIVDITCDSDGCLEQFIDRRDVKKVLDLHSPNPDKDYYLGFFLVGAYQESLANEHNLFGAINEAEVLLLPNGKWKINKITKGDPISELLENRNYDIEQMRESFKNQLDTSTKEKLISNEEAKAIFDRLDLFLSETPYLRGDEA